CTATTPPPPLLSPTDLFPISVFSLLLPPLSLLIFVFICHPHFFFLCIFVSLLPLGVEWWCGGASRHKRGFSVSLLPFHCFTAFSLSSL
ncbi:hypothetical protein VIGAN_04193900, partial [Vigna angularis var. angularis]